MEKYPRLYTISEQQNQLIQNMGTHKDTGWEWDFKWRRPFFDNEIQMAVSFIQEVEGLRIIPTIGDQWVWESDPTGQYSAKSAYNVLRQHLPMEAQGKSSRNFGSSRFHLKRLCLLEDYSRTGYQLETT